MQHTRHPSIPLLSPIGRIKNKTVNLMNMTNNELEDTENESRTNPVGNENNKRTSCFYFNE